MSAGQYPHTEDARLLALLHDIGDLVLSSLGSSYTALHAKLLADGLYPVEIERRLLGRPTPKSEPTF